AVVNRSVIGKRFVGNFGDDFAVLEHAHGVFADHLSDFDGVQSPLAEYAIDFFFAAFFSDEQHALLRFAQQNFVIHHAGFALRDEVHFNFQADLAARPHFAGGASKPGGAHVLNADDGSGLHGFEAGLE